MFFGLHVYKNGIVGRAMSLKSYVKYKMPKYTKTVFYLYEKYSAIQNKELDPVK